MDQNNCGCLDQLIFDNRFTQKMVADPSAIVQPRQVVGASFSKVAPNPVRAPSLVSYSQEMAAEIGLDVACCESADFVDVFSGNRVLAGMDPFAMCYGGHQFGSWAGQLGDGRAINLGEIIAPTGNRWTLQLKGAGLTPYSRTADGLAVMRSSLREYMCSEAMYHLGVPTTRALSLVATGEDVLRDMFYDGRSEHEPGAVVCRVAPSFIRFGNFQIHAARGEIDLLRQLVEFTIESDFPQLFPDDGIVDTGVILSWFREVARRTAIMVAQWMRVGFVHGVMNTDNMSILGLTIDYGPYGWLDNYDRGWTPNTTDAQGRRYRYGAQPGVASWNLAQLANALYPLLELGGDVSPLQEALDVYAQEFTECWHHIMAQKLGLDVFAEGEDPGLFEQLADVMESTEADMTNFYRALADLSADELRESTEQNLPASLLETLYRADTLSVIDRRDMCAWLKRYGRRLADNKITPLQRREVMNSVNPKYVPRNYLAQLAIDAVQSGDHRVLEDLMEVLRSPYDEQPGKEDYAKMRPEWARHRAGCSMLSCSS